MVLFKELTSYSYEELKIDKNLLNELKTKQIINFKDDKYFFKFVGIIIQTKKRQNKFIIVYPKYWPKILSFNDVKYKFLNIIKSIFKYYKQNNSNDNQLFNLLRKMENDPNNFEVENEYFFISELLKEKIDWEIKETKEKKTKKGTKHIQNYFFAFGIKKFEHLWEKVCCEYYDNSDDYRIDKQNNWSLLPKSSNKIKLKTLFDDRTLINWNAPSKKFFHKFDGFKLDIIKIEESLKTLSIFDAKYYYFDNENKEKTPKRGDILKQYLYQIWYEKEVCKKNDYSFQTNAFIFPVFSKKEENLSDGFVEIEKFNYLFLGIKNNESSPDLIELKKINLYFIYADFLFQNFINKN